MFPNFFSGTFWRETGMKTYQKYDPTCFFRETVGSYFHASLCHILTVCNVIDGDLATALLQQPIQEFLQAVSRWINMDQLVCVCLCRFELQFWSSLHVHSTEFKTNNTSQVLYTSIYIYTYIYIYVHLYTYLIYLYLYIWYEYNVQSIPIYFCSNWKASIRGQMLSVLGPATFSHGASKETNVAHVLNDATRG